MIKDNTSRVFINLWNTYSKNKNKSLSEEEISNDNIELAKFVNQDSMNGLKTTTYFLIHAGNDIVISEQITQGARTDMKAIARLSRLGYQDFIKKIEMYFRG